MPVDCITFDLDDTLWDCASVISRAEADFYAHLDRHMPAITRRFTADELMHSRRRFASANPTVRHDITALRKRWLAAMLAEHDYDEGLLDPAFDVFFRSRNAVELYEGVTDLLTALGKRFTIGAITNGNADVHYIGIGHLFDFVVTAADAGAAKPAPAIFHAALERCGAPPERVLHVGDDAARDVVGAAALGMRTAWINPALAPWPGGRNPDAVVRSVLELESVLAEWAAA